MSAFSGCLTCGAERGLLLVSVGARGGWPDANGGIAVVTGVGVPVASSVQPARVVTASKVLRPIAVLEI